jgi:hypothetical protein
LNDSLLPTTPLRKTTCSACSVAFTTRNITAGLEEQREELKGPVSVDIKYQNRKDFEKYTTRLEDGAAAIYNACSVSIRIHINKMFHSKAMWNELAERVNIASTEVGRQALNRSFTSI